MVRQARQVKVEKVRIGSPKKHASSKYVNESDVLLTQKKAATAASKREKEIAHLRKQLKEAEREKGASAAASSNPKKQQTNKKKKKQRDEEEEEASSGGEEDEEEEGTSDNDEAQADDEDDEDYSVTDEEDEEEKVLKEMQAKLREPDDFIREMKKRASNKTKEQKDALLRKRLLSSRARLNTALRLDTTNGALVALGLKREKAAPLRLGPSKRLLRAILPKEGPGSIKQLSAGAITAIQKTVHHHQMENVARIACDARLMNLPATVLLDEDKRITDDKFTCARVTNQLRGSHVRFASQQRLEEMYPAAIDVRDFFSRKLAEQRAIKQKKQSAASQESKKLEGYKIAVQQGVAAMNNPTFADSMDREQTRAFSIDLLKAKIRLHSALLAKEQKEQKKLEKTTHTSTKRIHDIKHVELPRKEKKILPEVTAKHETREVARAHQHNIVTVLAKQVTKDSPPEQKKALADARKLLDAYTEMVGKSARAIKRVEKSIANIKEEKEAYIARRKKAETELEPLEQTIKLQLKSLKKEKAFFAEKYPDEAAEFFALLQQEKANKAKATVKADDSVAEMEVDGAEDA